MRLILFLSIIGLSGFISIARPFYGLLVFTWLSYMRPQNLVWATEGWRFSYFIAIAVLVGTIVNFRSEKLFLKKSENYLLIALWVTIGLSTIFAMQFNLAFPKFLELSKIFLIAILTTGLVKSEKRFKYLCWVIALSFSFWATKGAIWGMLRGWRLSGPVLSMIEDNNDFALALNMVLPFFLYLGLNEQIKWRKLFFYLQFPFIIIAIIYTYSRGGFIGLCVVLLLLLVKAKRKILSFTLLVIGIILFFNFVPQEYKDRISTVQNYEEDSSAMGRINAWRVAINIGKARPLTGIGPQNFLQAWSLFDTQGDRPHVAHNSYFQILADSGFIALGLFLLLIYLCITKLRRIQKTIAVKQSTKCILNYSHMLEVGIIGYMASGFFLSRADFDLFYQFVGMAVALERIAFSENKGNKGTK